VGVGEDVVGGAGVMRAEVVTDVSAADGSAAGWSDEAGEHAAAAMAARSTASVAGRMGYGRRFFQLAIRSRYQYALSFHVRVCEA